MSNLVFWGIFATGFIFGYLLYYAVRHTREFNVEMLSVAIGALGGACGVDNLAAITKANYLCNEFGMDTITVGMTIACAMEMYEAEIIPESDIGQPLTFGDADGMITMLKKMALREGFGDKLA